MLLIKVFKNYVDILLENVITYNMSYVCFVRDCKLIFKSILNKYIIKLIFFECIYLYIML